MKRPDNLKAGDKFIFNEKKRYFGLKNGDVVVLKRDDGDSSPYFYCPSVGTSLYISFRHLVPFVESKRKRKKASVKKEKPILNLFEKAKWRFI
jgi:hypothetical protein